MKAMSSAPVIGEYLVTFGEETNVYELQRFEFIERLGFISLSHMTKGAISLIMVNGSWRDRNPENRTFRIELREGATPESVQKILADGGISVEMIPATQRADAT